MDWTALLKTISICSISIVIEAISATKEGRQWFEQLKKPKYSFSIKVWYGVGGVYYIIFGLISYRLFAAGQGLYSLAVILLVLVLISNGLGNLIAFKYRSLKWFYLIIYPFSILLIVLIILLLYTDKLSAALASIYFVWLIYDLYYGYHLWKLNGEI